MSRYVIEAHNPARFNVIVGYDPPMRTFFAQIYDGFTQSDEELDADIPAFQIGDNRYDEVPDIEGLIEFVSEWAVIPERVKTAMLYDKKHALPQTPLQREVEQIFGPLLEDG